MRTVGALAIAFSASAACGSSFTANDGAAGSSGAGATSAGSSGSAGKASAGGANEAGTGGSIANGGSSAGSAGSSAGEPGNAGTGGDTSSECPCAPPRPTCIAGRCVARGPQMVKAGSGNFYIDRTEVTVEQYGLFVRAKGDDTSGQAMECAWNESYEPAYPAGVTPGKDRPVTYVDYCDAAAYCAWADKQLCGRIGGGELKVEDSPVPNKGQWIAACGGPDGHLYPYGKDPKPGACNDGATKSLIDVGSLATCEGDARGLFDMLGNAQEWIAACDAHSGKLDGCERFGGSYLEAKACSESGLATRGTRTAELGFRCCSP